MGKGGGGGGSTVVGHAYSMGVAYGLCEKVDRLLAFKFEGDVTSTPYLSGSGSFQGQTGKVAPSHGSDSGENISLIRLLLTKKELKRDHPKGYTTIKFYDGTQSEADEYLTKQTGYALAYKKLAYFVVNGFIFFFN